MSHHVPIIQHEDCGAYGGSNAFQDWEQEKAQYLADMETLASAITSQYPSLIVERYIARLYGGVMAA